MKFCEECRKHQQFLSERDIKDRKRVLIEHLLSTRNIVMSGDFARRMYNSNMSGYGALYDTLEQLDKGTYCISHIDHEYWSKLRNDTIGKGPMYPRQPIVKHTDGGSQYMRDAIMYLIATGNVVPTGDLAACLYCNYDDPEYGLAEFMGLYNSEHHKYIRTEKGLINECFYRKISGRERETNVTM